MRAAGHYTQLPEAPVETFIRGLILNMQVQYFQIENDEEQ